MKTFNYLAFISEGLSEAGEDSFVDGCELMNQCLDAYDRRISDPEHFPVKLLILLASPAYAEPSNAERLLSGIHDTFQHRTKGQVELIGCTVSGVFFGGKIHDRGALLVCLSGRMLDVKTAVDINLRSDVAKSSARLLSALGLDFSGQGHDPNPLVNRLLLTFFAGYEEKGECVFYPGPQLHHELRKGTRARIPIVGGGSTAQTRRHGGLQFLGRKVCSDAAVCACITTGSPFGSSINDGLDRTGQILHVKKFNSDRRTILEFDEGRPADELDLMNPRDFAVLGRFSLDDDPANFVVRPCLDTPGAVKLGRDVGTGTIFEKLAPSSEKLIDNSREAFIKSLLRLRIENPVGCFGIHCAALRESKYDISALTSDVEARLRNEGPYVGGYFDGEIGIGQTGRSLFDNWCTVTLTFGDEMRERTPFQRGLDAVAGYADGLANIISSYQNEVNRAKEFDLGVNLSLDVVYNAGYPGAMISLVLENAGAKWLVARTAKGRRMERLKMNFRRSLVYGGLFDQIARGQHPRLIPNANDPSVSSALGSSECGLESLYIVPLRALDNEIIGFLHIDLGDIRYKTEAGSGNPSILQRICKEYERSLDPLGSVIESNIARLISRKEIQLGRALDEALKSNLEVPECSQAIQNFIEAAVKCFGADMGHIRLAQGKDENQTLELIAGIGTYYEVMRTVRTRLLVSDDSPTCIAFRDETGKLIINDAQNDPTFQKFRDENSPNVIINNAYNEVGAIANLVFRKATGEPFGTISLVSKRPWVFTRARMNMLDAMGRRLSYLLEHSQRQQNRRFLSQVGTEHMHNANFKDQLQTLTDAIERIRKAANADQAGLFIYNYETERFILRAQSGWSDHRWVDAARYAAGERWTGNVALAKEPQYLPDLYAYKTLQMDDPNRHYARYVFGRDLTSDFLVEALGIRLRFKKRTIGVLTLYRRVRSEEIGRGVSFTTTDPNVLQEAANNLAAMVNTQLYYLRVKWERREARRHALVREAIENRKNISNLESAICKQVLANFPARRVCLFLTPLHQPVNGGIGDLQWASGYTLTPKKEELLPETPGDLVKKAAATRNIENEIIQLKEGEWADPNRAKLEGLANRVCVPLLNGNRVVGVLDIEWDLPRILSSSNPSQRKGKLNAPQREIQSPHKSRWLKRLGQEIGSAYMRQQRDLQQSDQLQAEIRAARSRESVQAIGMMLFQSAHRLRNLTQSFGALSRSIAAANNDAERAKHLAEMSHLLETAGSQISRLLDFGRRIQQVAPSKFLLKSLVHQVIDEQAPHSLVSIDVLMPDDLTVWADYELVREACHNIVRNALQMMPQGGKLHINAYLSTDARKAHITFIDTGPGMTRKQISDARAGFLSTTGGTGYGILVAESLIRANGGSFDIDSSGTKGLRVQFTLPGMTGSEVSK